MAVLGSLAASPGRLLRFSKSVELLGNIWIRGTEWKVCVCGGNIWRKKLLPDVWANCYSSVSSVDVTTRPSRRSEMSEGSGLSCWLLPVGSGRCLQTCACARCGFMAGQCHVISLQAEFFNSLYFF